MPYKDAAVVLRVAGIVHSMTLSYCSCHTAGNIIGAVIHCMSLLLSPNSRRDLFK